MAALRTPLYDWHVARGARMVEFGGWDMPVQYTTIVEEHTTVRTGGGYSTSATWAGCRSPAPAAST